MDPNDNATNPIPQSGGQTPTPTQPLPPIQQPASSQEEVTIDFNQDTPVGAQPSSVASDGLGVQPSQAVDSQAPPVYPSAPVNNTGDFASNGTNQDPAYGGAQQAAASQQPIQSASTQPYGNPADPQAASVQPAQPQASPVQYAAFQPSQDGQPQQPGQNPSDAAVGQQPSVTPVASDVPQAQAPHDPIHLLGADKKTIFILGGVAVVLIIAIMTLLFV